MNGVGDKGGNRRVRPSHSLKTPAGIPSDRYSPALFNLLYTQRIFF